MASSKPATLARLDISEEVLAVPLKLEGSVEL